MAQARQPQQTLTLPERVLKDASGQRTQGMTMVIDNGLPYAHFTDTVDSYGGLIDLVKFGWGTSYVNPELAMKKADYLQRSRIAFCVGGTLFERFVAEKKFSDYVDYCKALNAQHVEVSDGTITMELFQKLAYIERLVAAGFTVFSEVGHKLPERQDELSDAKQWAHLVRTELAAGATKVILEARESGRFGIATADGKLRQDIIDALRHASVRLDRLIFEAPTKDLQVPLILQLGPNVNLGNVSPHDLVSVETLRLGLRGDTLLETLPDLSELPGRKAVHAGRAEQ